MWQNTDISVLYGKQGAKKNFGPKLSIKHFLLQDQNRYRVSIDIFQDFFGLHHFSSFCEKERKEGRGMKEVCVFVRVSCV